ncbi:MAG: hypothetical protein AB7P40_05060 [Chloroflexota bacterium]
MNDTLLSSSDREDKASLAILEAALEIGREDREWLGDRLNRGDVEQADLHLEVNRLKDALQGREAAISALSEQAATSAQLTSQLTRQISVLWEERERLLRFLQDATAERDQLVSSLNEATRIAEVATQAFEEIARDRDALAAEMERLRSGQPTDAGIVPTDLSELAQAVELMSEALGDVRRLAREARREGVRAGAATVSEDSLKVIAEAVEATLRAKLDPLAAIPQLQTEIGHIGTRIDDLAAGLVQPAAVFGLTGSPRPERAGGARLQLVSGADGADRRPAASELHGRPLRHGRTRPLLTVPAVERALARALPGVGLPRGVVSPLLSAWLAGATPIISGREALTALTICGRVLAANQVVVVRMESGYQYPEQLFGQSDTVGSLRSPLLDLLLSAQSPAGRERLSLVVFEGVNRAAVERVLLPLLRHIADRDGITDERSLGQFLPDEVTEDERYASLAAAPWPSNVLVAATIAETDDLPTQPLPSSLWARAAYLCLDHLPAPLAGLAVDDDPVRQQAMAGRVSFVPSELWDSWRAETRDEAELTACVSGDVEILDSRRDVVATWRMIEAALAVIGRCHPVQRTATVLLHHSVVPWAVSAGLDREAAQLVQSHADDGAPPSSSPHPCCTCLERAIRGSSGR